MFIPDNIKFIFEKLENKGYECFAVGGCVRDSFMGITPDDWDFTTNATPDKIAECFSDYRLITVGSKFGTIGVIDKGKTYEITTFRADGEYNDSRHPDFVSFSDDIEDDLVRRDFTINSMAYNENRGLVDPFGGRKDIENRIIRCTGDPLKRFDEDAIRIMRALRFSSRLGFDIDKCTSDALIQKAKTLGVVHPQRLRKELSGLVMGKYAHKILRDYHSVVSVIIPEIKDSFNCEQNNPHHIFDVWNHTVKAFENADCDEEVRFCLLFHDLGKPKAKTIDSRGINHFKGHQQISAEIAERNLVRFGFPHTFVSNVVKLIRFHDERFKNGDSDIKRVLRELGEELFFKLMTVSRADILGQSEYKRDEKLLLISSVENRAREILDRNECYSLASLKVNGDDIHRLGFSGEIIGKILAYVLDAVISGDCLNEKDSLIKYIQKHFR